MFTANIKYLPPFQGCAVRAGKKGEEPAVWRSVPVLVRRPHVLRKEESGGYDSVEETQDCPDLTIFGSD